MPDTVADPSIVCFDGTYYLYATTDIDEGLSRAGPPVIWKSKDFLNWSFNGILIPGVKWGKIRYWAPGKVVEKHGIYYLYVTVVNEKDDACGYVATAKKPEGPFQFVGGPPVFQDDPATGQKALQPLVPDIDGEPFIDDDGSAYIFWRRRHACKLSDDLLSLTGPVVDIPTRQQGYSEGPFMFKRKGIYYYVYTISGHEDYKNAYMMSKTSPLGPFYTPPSKMAFVEPTLGHSRNLEKSTDSQSWGLCGEQNDIAIRSPDIVENIGKTRYLRLKIKSGKTGIWEFKIF